MNDAAKVVVQINESDIILYFGILAVVVLVYTIILQIMVTKTRRQISESRKEFDEDMKKIDEKQRKVQDKQKT
ncbi:hypothetical protein [Lacticaseibacillus saniviri]